MNLRYTSCVIFIFALFAIFSFQNVFADTIINGDNYLISEDTVWTKDAGPYLVEQTAIVDDGITLIIEPGTIIKFSNGQSLLNFGKIIANGTSANKITFTSLNDFWSGISNIGGEMKLKYSIVENIDNTAIETAFLGSTTIQNSVIQNVLEAIQVSDGSSMSFSDSEITNVNYGFDTAAVFVYDDSSLNIFNVNITNLQSKYGVVGFNGADISFSSSTILYSGSRYALDIYNDDNYATGSLMVDKSVIDGGGDTGILIMGKVDANITNTQIQDFGWAGIDISDYSGQYPKLNISGSQLKNNFVGISNWTGNVTITNSSIIDNLWFGIFANDDVNFPFSAKNNWWGDASGPLGDLNLEGIGDTITGNVDFNPWLTADPTLPVVKKNVPIILIPGIMGSVLSKNYGDNAELWPNTNSLITSISDNFMDDLALTASGTEDILKPLTVGDIMRKVDVSLLGFHYTTHLFDGLIEILESGGYVEGTDLFVFPYDWRKDNADNAILLKQKIDEVLAQTGNPKVDLIAHSMGGLVAKKYIVDEGTSTIDKIFFIGTPHLGAPKAFKALMWGDDMGIGINNDTLGLHIHMLSPAEVKFISQNMPGVFELLPSESYTNISKYVYDDTIKNDWLSFDETENYMASSGRNTLIFPIADSLHEVIDTLDLTNINSYNFSGCGTTKTIGQILSTKKTDTIKDKKIQYVNGDTTVPLISSNLPAKENYFVAGYQHSELPSANGVPQDILSIIQNGNTVADYINISLNSDICQVSGKSISVHSPVSLDIYDDDNNHTGVTNDGTIEYGISGVSFDEIDGEKFAFIPDGTNYTIILNGESSGTFDLNIEDISGTDEITNKESWLNVPIQGTSSKFQIDIGTSTEHFILADENGDGDYENNLSEGYDGAPIESSKKRRRHTTFYNGEATTSELVFASEVQPIKPELTFNRLEQSSSTHILASTTKKSQTPVIANKVKQSRLIPTQKNNSFIKSTSSVQNTASVYESGGIKLLKSFWRLIIIFFNKVI